MFRLLEASDHTLFSDVLEIHLVQLPRLSELTEANRLDDAALLRWTRFFSAESAEQVDEAAIDLCDFAGSAFPGGGSQR